MRLFVLAVLVIASTGSQANGPFEIQNEQGDFIGIYERANPVLRYVKGEILPAGVPEDRRRSSYVHPIFSLDGKPLSDDFPKDHYHHRGMSWIWLKVAFEGVTKDLWTLRGIHQKYVGCESRTFEDRARLVVGNGWYEDSTARKIIDEKVALTAYRADEAGRIIDCEVQLAAVDTPVKIGVSETGYSGFNIRFAPRQDTIITTCKGLLVKDENRTRYAWVDLCARFGGSDEFDGITIFDNKRNPHYPSGWTLRFYGVLNPAFTSTSTDYEIRPGAALVLRYRLYVHRGKADASKLHTMFEEYNSGGPRVH